MSKIKTFSIIPTRITYQFGNPYLLAYKDPKQYSANILKLVTGVNQRRNILPKNLSLEANKKKNWALSTKYS